MKNLFKSLWWIIRLPFRIVWKLRKLIMLGGAAAGAFAGWQKRQATQDDAVHEESDD